MMQANKTPKNSGGPGRRKGHEQNKKTPQKMIFETHWAKEKVDDEIKRGAVFVGPIRINPKNYKDCYVPLPDGKVDVLINGSDDRNRALNGDLVAVMPNHVDYWRVNLEEFDEYIKSPRKKNGIIKSTDGNEDGNDSGPDVIVESDTDDCDNTIDNASKVNNVKSALKQLQKLTVGNNGNSSPTGTASSSPNTNKDVRTNKRFSTPDQKFVTVMEARKLATNNPIAFDRFGAKLQKVTEENTFYNSELSKFVQVTGKVVAIYEAKHCRVACGQLKSMSDKIRMIQPTDCRIPGIIINDVPQELLTRPKDFESTIFVGRIEQWDETSRMPKGKIEKRIEGAGQIEPETEALLLSLDINDTPFSQQVLDCLPQQLPWVIPQEEFSYRKDLRKLCIFSIDPATARDLDDAMSIEVNDDGTYRIGVHIADVSFFVKEHNELDKTAAQRATSVYLVQRVIPMLPRLLCEELCSLNPDEDRLAFSVMWTINDKAEILDEWFGRTVIRSCAKLSYDHAQGFIEEPEKKWTQEDLPPITNGFDVQDIQTRVLQLNKIAVILRQRRFDSGALRLDQVKIQYHLDKETGQPNGYSVYKQRDSNRLIEEFMLLANMAVAHKIKHFSRQKAILRRHPPPQVKPLQAVADLCGSLGLKIEFDSAGTLQESIRKISKNDDTSLAKMQVLIAMLSRPMQNAKYFCAGVFEDENMFHHYALNVPLYTHFTSPIRRYADVMVHRLLAASLDYCDESSLATEHLNKQANHCNEKKSNAKIASDKSSEMFFSLFVKQSGVLYEKGMVMAVLDKAFDVLILKYGVVKRVYAEKLNLKEFSFQKDLYLTWNINETCSQFTRQTIRPFTMVDCKLYTEDKPLQYSCIILRPKEQVEQDETHCAS